MWSDTRTGSGGRSEDASVLFDELQVPFRRNGAIDFRRFVGTELLEDRVGAPVKPVLKGKQDVGLAVGMRKTRCRLDVLVGSRHFRPRERRRRLDDVAQMSEYHLLAAMDDARTQLHIQEQSHLAHGEDPLLLPGKLEHLIERAVEKLAKGLVELCGIAILSHQDYICMLLASQSGGPQHPLATCEAAPDECTGDSIKCRAQEDR
jgi:hypothetical protein